MFKRIKVVVGLRYYSVLLHYGRTSENTVFKNSHYQWVDHYGNTVITKK